MPAGDVRMCCDRMLAGLARWLRAAGYDTALAEAGEADRAIAARCRSERRALLTRDRHLAAHAGNGIEVWLLIANNIDAQALHLARSRGIDWMQAPFTRCMLDNTPLREAAADELGAIPPLARALPGPFRTCPGCGRLYWPGSHVRRMTARLMRWRTDAARLPDDIAPI